MIVVSAFARLMKHTTAFMTMPTLEYELLTENGEPGWTATWYNHQDDESMTPLDKPIHTTFVDETRVFISTSTPPGITKRWSMKLQGQLKPRPTDTNFEFGLSVAGRAKVITI